MVDDDTSTSSAINVNDVLFEDHEGNDDEAVADNDDDELFRDYDDEEVCPRCASCPCEWIELGDAVLQQSNNSYYRETRDGMEVIIDDNGVKVPNSKMRKILYKNFTYLKFGRLGKNNHIPIPSCVLDKSGNFIQIRREIMLDSIQNMDTKTIMLKSPMIM
jgi:hypothetical protein